MTIGFKGRALQLKPYSGKQSSFLASFFRWLSPQIGSTGREFEAAAAAVKKAVATRKNCSLASCVIRSVYFVYFWNGEQLWPCLLTKNRREHFLVVIMKIGSQVESRLNNKIFYPDKIKSNLMFQRTCLVFWVGCNNKHNQWRDITALLSVH